MLAYILKKSIKQKIQTPQDLARKKREGSFRFGQKIPSNIQLLKVYHEMLAQRKIKRNPQLERLLKTRGIRTSSGVAIITVLTKPWPCPGRCFYCPNERAMPKSYLKNEPAAQRAYQSKFDPFQQVKIRLDALAMTGHATDKIELIILGGTWSAYPETYQYWFIKECFRAANAGSSKFKDQALKSNLNDRNLRKSLKLVQKKNENAKHRVIGLTLETRPDFIDLAEIRRMRDLGCTRVELGVQSIYDDVLKKNLRGHDVAQTKLATRLLKDAGFKVNYHIMLNLPGSTPRRDEKMFEELFSNSDFQPDLLKIYPCVVLKTAPLYRFWKQGKYEPYSEKQLINLILRIKKIIPHYVRIQRIIRDIPGDSIMAGNKLTNLRQILDNSGAKICCCIRCREIRGTYSSKDKIKLFRRQYLASGGKEIFLSYENPNQKKLYALLRLRFPSPAKETLPVLKDTALIRELHTYGYLVSIGKKDKQKAQHSGLGKKLMIEAKKIVSKEGFKKIAVISGIGVRQYYKNLGYGLKDEYMIKKL
jgi:elongator complex protein 3